MLSDFFIEIDVEGTENKKGGKKFKEQQIEEFDDLGLKNELLRGIFSYGFEKPSKIQKKGIIPIINSTPPADVIVMAQSGTGKTAMFLISMLHKINPKENNLQGMVIAPTRDLCIAIYNLLKELNKYTKYKTHICVGGTEKKNDINIFAKGCHIVVGTLESITHFIQNEFLDVRKLKMLVVDEADVILSSKESKKQLYTLYKHLSEKTQSCVCSSIMTSNFIQKTEKFLLDPIKFIQRREQITLEGVKQFFIDLKDIHKYITLKDLFKLNISRLIIYVNSEKKADYLEEKMKKDEMSVLKLTSEENFEKITKEFRTGASRALITTDKFAKRVDFHRVPLFLNYDFPKEKENYLRRIGQSGAYGKKHICINFINEKEKEKKKEVEDYFETKIDTLPMNVEKFFY